MTKVTSFSKGFRSIVFWSIISAAFIGPGTVTTASKAGASFQIALLWALVFSTFATIILQEAAARITIASGKNLGEIIALKYQNSSSKLSWAVFLSIAFGCAAYQAGNMLGAIEGMKLMTDTSPKILTIGLAVFAFAILMLGNFRSIANVLGIVVALMGVAFIYVAFQTDFDLGELLQAAVIPSFPENSSLLIIGLVGTTIVPYNLFLASGITQGQSISEMRVGIVMAVLIGGLISMAIMLVGAQLIGEFSFGVLAEMMKTKMGNFGGSLFAFGLFAAGLTSSITAPLAAAVTAKSLFGSGKKEWEVKGKNFRLVWGIILLVGLISGLTIGKPIPAIIAAQAINGILLPIVAIFLILAVNDSSLIPKEYLNSNLSNLIMILLVAVSCFLGINNIFSALGETIEAFKMSSEIQFSLVSTLALLVMCWLVFKIFISQKLTFPN
ncbi:MAG: Nramp family divalent metal transporter [Saprospiraceae bacterium]